MTTPLSEDRRRAVQFFATHSGYSKPPGRMACARNLAEAEAKGKALGLMVNWEEECEPWDGEPLPEGCEVLCAYIEGPKITCPTCGHTRRNILASLGMISIMPHDDCYRRVVEAELMAEALSHAGEAK